MSTSTYKKAVDLAMAFWMGALFHGEGVFVGGFGVGDSDFLSVSAPADEVFAVIGHQIVLVLSDTGRGPCHDHFGGVGYGAVDFVNFSPVGKFVDGDNGNFVEIVVDYHAET